MNERDMNRLVHWVERAQYDLAQIQEILRADADTDTRTRTRPSTDTRPRVVNTQNSNNNPTVNNKQTKTCVCVSVTGDTTENTHTQVLSLDFVQSNLPEGIPAWYAAYWFEQMKRRNWSLKDGKRITAANWQYFLGVFFSHATDEELAAAQKLGKERPQSTEDLAALRERLLAENERMWA